MITNKNIGNVLTFVEKEVRKHSPPVVTLVAQMDKDPYKVLIATLLSLRTKDEITAITSEALFKVATTPEQMVKLPIKKIEKIIFKTGFYRNKARTLQHVSQVLLDKYDGNVPDDLDELLTIKGIGRKTANLVLIEGFSKPGMCVDTHVHRISNRWGYVKETTPDKTEMALRKKLPKKYWMRYNEFLVGFGQQICNPVSPKCSQCPLEKICPKKGVKHSR